MHWNSIPNDERLRLWKKLRADISDLSLQQQLSEIAKFCSKMPIGARTIDYYSPDTWPSPWDILFHGSFCPSSVSLLIFYTMTLINNQILAELYMVEDDTGIFLLPVFDNQYVLNFELGAVNNYLEIQNNFKVLQKYTKNQIKTIS
jgi:hypothetical protein